MYAHQVQYITCKVRDWVISYRITFSAKIAFKDILRYETVCVSKRVTLVFMWFVFNSRRFFVSYLALDYAFPLAFGFSALHVYCACRICLFQCCCCSISVDSPQSPANAFLVKSEFNDQQDLVLPGGQRAKRFSSDVPSYQQPRRLDHSPPFMTYNMHQSPIMYKPVG